MADGKIAIDLDRIAEKYSKKGTGNGGKEENYDLDKIMDYDARQTMIERMQKRGQLSMTDLYLLNKMERDEKRELMMQQNPQNNVEDIIRRSQEPLLKQIEKMEREKELEKQEAKFDRIDRDIASIKDLLTNGNGKKSENENLLKKLDDLTNELRDEKEKTREKEQKRFQDSFMDQLDRVNDAIEGLRHQPQSKGVLEQLKELNALKKDLTEALGIKEQGKEEEAGLGDLVDTFADKGPKIVKTISTMRDAFKGEDTLQDDVPLDNIPTNLPERAKARENKSVIPSDIKEFLDQGMDTPDGYKDASGIVWRNKITGVTLHRNDIEDLAITDPEYVRGIMKQVNEDLEEQRKQRTAERKRETEQQKAPEPVTSPAAPEEKKVDEVDNNADAMQKAMDYIATGTEKKDQEGVLQWVGQHDETYIGDHGPMTKEELIAEAKKDPAGFMKDVTEHLSGMEEE